MNDFNFITPLLAQGSAPLVGARGFDVVVLCARELQTDIPDSALSPAEVMRVPLEDRTDRYPSVAEVALAMRTAKRLKRRLLANKCVLVTCHAGINRSGLVSALALMEMGYDARGAVAAVRAARNDAAVAIGASRALFNKRFVEILDAVQLKKEGKRCREGSSRSSRAASRTR